MACTGCFQKSGAGELMRILYHHRIKSKDGQYVHIEELVHALRGQGHEVEIRGPGDIQEEEFGGESAVISALKQRMPGALYELLEFGYSVFDFLRMMYYCLSARPDFIYERYNLFFLSGVWAARLLRIPLLLEVNAPLYEERSRYDGIALRRFARWTERRAWQGANAVFAVTRVLGDKIAREGVAQEKIHIIPNGIRLEQFMSGPDPEEARRQLGLGGRFVVGFTGFVREWHGLERLLEYTAQHSDPDMHILIVGDGPHCDYLRQRAGELGIADQMTITGIIERKDIPRYVATFDIAVQPNVVDYASPLKLFEYMAMGKAIIAPDKSNIREVLDEQGATLFDTESDASFFEAVHRLRQSGGLRRQLGEHARQTIMSKGLDWDNNARRVIAIAGGDQ